MGQYAEAAIRFEDLAEELRANTSLRAELLAQAGQAWHQAGEIDRAYTTHSLALEAAPSDANIRIDRAMVLAERGQYELAIEDLDAALAANPSTVQALILRAVPIAISIGCMKRSTMPFGQSNYRRTIPKRIWNAAISGDC